MSDLMSDQIDTLFASRGLRCTRQRKALYQALAASRAHPTADDLFREVSVSVEGISLATVYNTLEAFCQAGLVQKLPGAGTNGSSRYDAVRGDHLHMRCRHTGAVDDVPADISREILERIPPEAAPPPRTQARVQDRPGADRTRRPTHAHRQNAAPIGVNGTK